MAGLRGYSPSWKSVLTQSTYGLRMSLWQGCMDLLSGLIHCRCGQLAGNHKCVFLWCIVNTISWSVIFGWIDVRCTLLLLPSDQFTWSRGKYIFTPTLRCLEKGQGWLLHQDETLICPKIFSDSYLQYSTEEFGACSILTGMLFTQLIWLIVSLNGLK